MSLVKDYFPLAFIQRKRRFVSEILEVPVLNALLPLGRQVRSLVDLALGTVEGNKETDADPRITYADYNCFFNPKAAGAAMYADGMIEGGKDAGLRNETAPNRRVGAPFEDYRPLALSPPREPRQTVSGRRELTYRLAERRISND